MHQGLIHTCICIEDSLAIQIFRIRRTISLSLIGFKEYLHITKHFFNESNQSLSRNNDKRMKIITSPPIPDIATKKNEINSFSRLWVFVWLCLSFLFFFNYFSIIRWIILSSYWHFPLQSSLELIWTIVII